MKIGTFLKVALVVAEVGVAIASNNVKTREQNALIENEVAKEVSKQLALQKATEEIVA